MNWPSVKNFRLSAPIVCFSQEQERHPFSSEINVLFPQPASPRITTEGTFGKVHGTVSAKGPGKGTGTFGTVSAKRLTCHPPLYSSGKLPRSNSVWNWQALLGCGWNSTFDSIRFFTIFFKVSIDKFWWYEQAHPRGDPQWPLLLKDEGRRKKKKKKTKSKTRNFLKIYKVHKYVRRLRGSKASPAAYRCIVLQENDRQLP